MNTLDGLVNGGSPSTIVGFEFDSKKVLECIIICFDSKMCEEEQKLKYPFLTEKYKEGNGTPIFCYKFEYQKRTKRGFGLFSTAKTFQFPIQIKYASTARRIQGSTIKSGIKVNIQWSKDFKRKTMLEWLMCALDAV